jgi:hypothetical protein
MKDNNKHNTYHKKKSDLPDEETKGFIEMEIG